MLTYVLLRRYSADVPPTWLLWLCRQSVVTVTLCILLDMSLLHVLSCHMYRFTVNKHFYQPISLT